MIFDLLPYIAAIVMVFSYLPQIKKIVENKSTKDLSFITWSIWIIFMGIMTIHAYNVNDIPFMISQGGQVIMILLILLLMFRYRVKS